MYISKSVGGTKVGIIVRQTTEMRLRKKCFRGVTSPLAGNFFRWSTVWEFFRDQLIMEMFLAEIGEVIGNGELGTFSVNIPYTSFVGWESTDVSSKYEASTLEEFWLNRNSWALRVKCDRTDLRAPLTRQVTIVYELKREEDKMLAIVHSIYPGKDVGDLTGDVSSREGRVFFDWGHPGQA